MPNRFTDWQPFFEIIGKYIKEYSYVLFTLMGVMALRLKSKMSNRELISKTILAMILATLNYYILIHYNAPNGVIAPSCGLVGYSVDSVYLVLSNIFTKILPKAITKKLNLSDCTHILDEPKKGENKIEDGEEE